MCATGRNDRTDQISPAKKVSHRKVAIDVVYIPLDFASVGPIVVVVAVVVGRGRYRRRVPHLRFSTFSSTSTCIDRLAEEPAVTHIHSVSDQSLSLCVQSEIDFGLRAFAFLLRERERERDERKRALEACKRWMRCLFQAQERTRWPKGRRNVARGMHVDDDAGFSLSRSLLLSNSPCGGPTQ